jgi:SH3-like domain-containing protein
MKSLSEQARLKNVANILARLKEGKSITAREQRLIDAASEGRELITKEDVARRYGITSQAATGWVRKGCPLTSWEEIEAWRKERLEKGAAGDLKDQKLAKEVELLDLKIQQQKGELVSRSAMREAGQRVGALIVAELAAMANDAPGQLAGADEATIRERLEARHVVLVNRLRTAIGEIETVGIEQ